MDGKCAMCQVAARLCRVPGGKAPDFCSTRLYGDVLAQAREEYDKPALRDFAAQSSRQEKACYLPDPDHPDLNIPQKPRVVEIVEFCGRMGYKRLGLAFCGGLHQEASSFARILQEHGFEVVSVMCKVGGVDKTALGLTDEEKIGPGGHESMCNPIAQAMILNQAATEFNIILGLCVGHDSLFIKYSQAMCTVLAVKDRVLGHNPLAALYTAHSYYRYIK